MSIARDLLTATDCLSESLRGLRFGAPVSHVYNPLDYARDSHGRYVRRFAGSLKRVLLMGMNPGPWGMAQTGVPFGEVAAVRDWMGISGAVGRPEPEHSKRPVSGFACEKSEVSGRRLWGLFSDVYAKADDFFAGSLCGELLPLDLDGGERSQSHSR